MRHKTDKEVVGEQLSLFALPANGFVRNSCPIEVMKDFREITSPPKEFIRYD